MPKTWWRPRQSDLFFPLRQVDPCWIEIDPGADFFDDDHDAASIWSVIAVIMLAHQHRFVIRTQNIERAHALLTQQSEDEIAGYRIVTDGAHVATNAARRLISRGTRPSKGLDPVPPGAIKAGTRRHLDNIFRQRWPIPNLAVDIRVADERELHDRIHLLGALPVAEKWLSVDPDGLGSRYRGAGGEIELPFRYESLLTWLSQDGTGVAPDCIDRDEERGPAFDAGAANDVHKSFLSAYQQRPPSEKLPDHLAGGSMRNLSRWDIYSGA